MKTVLAAIIVKSSIIQFFEEKGYINEGRSYDTLEVGYHKVVCEQ